MDYSVKLDLDRDAAGDFEEDITPYVLANSKIVIERGRRDGLHEQQPSTLELVLNNADGRFSPDKGTYSGLDHFIRVQVKENDNGSYRFTGWITGFELDPGGDQMTATIRATDMLGMGQSILVSMSTIRDRTADLSLNRVLDLMEAGEVIGNHGCEDDTTGYASILSATLSRETSDANTLEGEGALKTITPNSADKEGWEHDLEGYDGWDGGAFMFGLFIKGTLNDTITIYAYSTEVGYSVLEARHEDVTCTGNWQYVMTPLVWTAGHTGCSVRVVTDGQQGITFYCDDLHLAPYANRIDRSLETGQTTLQRVSFGDEPADVALKRIVDSEPGLMWFDGEGQFVFKNKDRLTGNAAANFGYESIGAQTPGYSADTKATCKFTLSTFSYVETVIAYCYANAGSVNMRAIIYSDDSGPDELLMVSDELSVDTTTQWNTFTFLSQRLEAGDYWIGLISDGAWKIKMDTGDANQTAWYNDTYSDGPADPFGSVSSQAYELSIYATYRYANPELIWDDSGSNKKYQNLQVTSDAESRVRFVRITSQGFVAASGEFVTVWEYLGVPFTLSAVSAAGDWWRTIYMDWGFDIATDAAVTVSPAAPGDYDLVLSAYGTHGSIWIRNRDHSSDWVVTRLYIEGTILEDAAEDSLYEYEADADVWVHRSIETEMWFLGEGFDEVAIRQEAKRLGDKYVNRVLRGSVGVRPDTSGYLTDILALELADCVSLQNDILAHSLNIDKNCWVEGVKEIIQVGALIGGVEFVFSVEEA